MILRSRRRTQERRRGKRWHNTITTTRPSISTAPCRLHSDPSLLRATATAAIPSTPAWTTPSTLCTSSSGTTSAASPSPSLQAETRPSVPSDQETYEHLYRRFSERPSLLEHFEETVRKDWDSAKGELTLRLMALPSTTSSKKIFHQRSIPSWIALRENHPPLRHAVARLSERATRTFERKRLE